LARVISESSSRAGQVKVNIKGEIAMPMDFPDMKSLKHHAEILKFRQPNEGETEEQFRTALADFVEPLDFIESQEIRNKVGWNKFDKSQNMGMLMAAALRGRK
jgi:hypothetical protein